MHQHHLRAPTGLPSRGWTDVSTGDYSATCGIRSEILYCWGMSYANGKQTDTIEPTLASGSAGWVDVEAGVWHSVGLMSSGDLFYWGWSSYGALPYDDWVTRIVDTFLDWTSPLFADAGYSLAVSGETPYAIDGSEDSPYQIDLDLQ